MHPHRQTLAGTPRAPNPHEMDVDESGRASCVHIDAPEHHGALPLRLEFAQLLDTVGEGSFRHACDFDTVELSIKLEVYPTRLAS